MGITVKHESPGQRLRVYVDETDTWEEEPLYRAIVRTACELGLAGATVVRGLMGFGAGRRLRGADGLLQCEDLPVVIEIVDTPAQIRRLLPFLDEMVREGLFTLEEVHIIAHRAPKPGW